MRVSHASLVLGVLVVVLVAPVVGAGHEEEIPLSEVPQHVLDAARAAVPGITLTEAEVDRSDSAVVYELEGELDGQEYEIDVSAAGEVLEVELEDDDDEAGDDDPAEGED